MTEIQTITPNTSFSQIIPTLQIAYDQTSLGELQLCPWKYQQSIINGYEPRETNVHFVFGIEYHHAFEVYDNLRAEKLNHTDALNETIKSILIRTWNQETQRPWTSENPYKNRHTLIRSFIWYLERFKDDPLETIILDSGKPAVELLFSIEIGCKSKLTGEPFVLCGRMDKLVYYENKIAITDKKTTKNQINQSFFHKFSPDNQVSAYMTAGGFILNEPVETMLIDAAQILVNSTVFQRGLIHRHQSQLEEWMKDVWIHISHAEEYVERNYWPRNYKACGLPHLDPKTQQIQLGCPFREVCTAEESMRPLLLEANFNKRIWDPIKPRDLED